ncbi:CoA-binding protein [Myroides sp. LJL115]
MNVVVIGASLKPERYSNQAICLLKQYHHNVYAYGPRSGSVCQVNIDTELNKYKDIHTVTMYINPNAQMELYQYIISLQPKRVLFNPGTENPEFYALLKENGINYEEGCTLVLLRTNQF